MVKIEAMIRGTTKVSIIALIIEVAAFFGRYLLKGVNFDLELSCIYLYASLVIVALISYSWVYLIDSKDIFTENGVKNLTELAFIFVGLGAVVLYANGLLLISALRGDWGAGFVLVVMHLALILLSAIIITIFSRLYGVQPTAKSESLE